VRRRCTTVILPPDIKGWWTLSGHWLVIILCAFMRCFELSRLWSQFAFLTVKNERVCAFRQCSDRLSCDCGKWNGGLLSVADNQRTLSIAPCVITSCSGCFGFKVFAHLDCCAHVTILTGFRRSLRPAYAECVRLAHPLPCSARTDHGV
jgi:hypothetical protein